MTTTETKLSLSEAMRLGAMLKPQGFGIWDTFRPEVACALNAVRLAIGGEMFLLDRFPILKTVTDCPVCGPEANCRTTLNVVIASHLNDDHRWTRERIADWIEAEFESTPPAAPEQELEAVAV